MALGRLEDGVAFELRLERRVEANEVHAFAGDGVAKDEEIIAVVKLVHSTLRR